jgi:hypothetical protein
MGAPSRSPGFWLVGSLHWRHFMFAWLAPIFVYLSMAVESQFGTIQVGYLVWILMFEIAVLVLFGVFASAPYRHRHITRGQALFWILLVPVFISVVLSLLPFRFPITVVAVDSRADVTIGSSDQRLAPQKGEKEVTNDVQQRRDGCTSPVGSLIVSAPCRPTT